MTTIEPKRHSGNTDAIVNYITTMIRKNGYIVRNIWAVGIQQHFLCGSYKAALRHLRKHDEIPKGTRFVLVSRFVGGDRVLVKR